MNVLVTGGCGFIGSNFIRRRLASSDDTIVNLDALTYAGNQANLRELEGNARYRFIHGRIEDPVKVKEAMAGADAVVHFAAESHVDRSIADAASFITTNVLGTHVLLDSAHKTGVKRFVHVSTDEVYGALGKEGKFTETTPLRPRSPYSASKAAGDMLAQAFWETHKLPVMIVRPSNNYGPYQFPEKFIPLMVTNLIEGRKVPVYGRGENVRDWLHVEDCCRAIEIVLDRGRPGEAYNIGGESERRNIDVVNLVIALMGLSGDEGRGTRDEGQWTSTSTSNREPGTKNHKPGTSVREPGTKNQELETNEFIELVPDRPGHDFRYALDNAKIRTELCWQPEVRFEDGLRRTVDWYREHPEWWQPRKARLARESAGFWTKDR
jgi:dTDP-glucose 4,6-dehydratase